MEEEEEVEEKEEGEKEEREKLYKFGDVIYAPIQSGFLYTRTQSCLW